MDHVGLCLCMHDHLLLLPAAAVQAAALIQLLALLTALPNELPAQHR